MSLPNLPSGTDIAGSTKRWVHHRDQMQAALTRHDELLRDAIAAHGGCYVVKTVGDAFNAVYTNADAALHAALAAQRAVLAEPWCAECPIRVRMALHARDHAPLPAPV